MNYKLYLRHIKLSTYPATFVLIEESNGNKKQEVMEIHSFNTS
jgi:hypothetical protein